MTRVPTDVHEPAAAVATADSSASASLRGVRTAVVCMPSAVHEPAVAVATANALALAPRSAVTVVSSVPTVAVHEPAVAVGPQMISRQHLAVPLLLWRAYPIPYLPSLLRAHSLGYMSTSSLLQPQMLRRQRLFGLLLLWLM